MVFSRQQRLKKEKDFEEVFKKGKTVKGSFFFIRMVLTSAPNLRCAVVVPAKTTPLAVSRNAIRRRLTAMLQDLLAGLSGFDLVLVVSHVPEKDSSEVRQEIASALGKLGIAIS